MKRVISCLVLNPGIVAASSMSFFRQCRLVIDEVQ